MNQYSVPFAAFGGLGFGGISFFLGLHQQRILIEHRRDIDELKVGLNALTDLGLSTVAGEINNMMSSDNTQKLIQ